jgi:hypothetical protein
VRADFAFIGSNPCRKNELGIEIPSVQVIAALELTYNYFQSETPGPPGS